MTCLRSHSKLEVSGEVSCPQPVVGAADTAVQTPRLGWRTGTDWGWVGWESGEGVLQAANRARQEVDNTLGK